MKIFILLAVFVIFTAGGVYGIFFHDYVQTHVRFFNWVLLLTFPLGIYYAFALTPGYGKNRGGGVAFLRIIITIFVTMLSFRSLQGYGILVNSGIGKQSDINIKGKITYTDFPNPKGKFGKYSIHLLLNDYNKITLEVPTANYTEGEPFERTMKQGSLGILYDSE